MIGYGVLLKCSRFVSARFSVSSLSVIASGSFRQFDVARCARGMVSRVPVAGTAVPLSGVGAVQ